MANLLRSSCTSACESSVLDGFLARRDALLERVAQKYPSVATALRSLPVPHVGAAAVVPHPLDPAPPSLDAAHRPSASQISVKFFITERAHTAPPPSSHATVHGPSPPRSSPRAFVRSSPSTHRPRPYFRQ